MVIFTKEFRTLDPHLPIVWVPKKTFFLTPSLKGVARVGMRDFEERIVSMGGSEV